MADRNKTIKRVALAGGAGLALWYLLGRGKGFGGRRAEAQAARHCTLRLSAAGLTVGGQPMTVAAAADHCRGGRSELAVTGDANYGQALALRAALKESGVSVADKKANP